VRWGWRIWCWVAVGLRRRPKLVVDFELEVANFGRDRSLFDEQDGILLPDLPTIHRNGQSAPAT
jgi:hypothetical protein